MSQIPNQQSKLAKQGQQSTDTRPDTRATDPATTINAADKIGQKTSTNALPDENPSILSSAGAIGKQFNPDGAIGGIGQKIGGPLDRFGVIGSQFDASQNGIAGHVERAVDGPRNPAGSSK